MVSGFACAWNCCWQRARKYSAIAGITLKRNYDLCAPKGVNGRNSDNTLMQNYLGWEPNIPLRTGLEKTYRWIYDQCLARERGEAGVVRERTAAR